MNSSAESTKVLFADGATVCDARVIDAWAAEDGCRVVTDVTVFYPVNQAWPDQPSDRGRMDLGAISLDVDHAEVERLGEKAGPISRIVHQVHADEVPPVGSIVRMRVDEERRRAVSRQHSACHLMALALNAAVAGYWRKPVETIDSLGSPDFDKLAVTRSTMTACESTDVYRLGKSLRRKGFDKVALEQSIDDVTARVVGMVGSWVGTDARVSVVAEGPRIDDHREWTTDLPPGRARIPCGGTHAPSLGALGRVTVEMAIDGDEMTVVTRATGFGAA